MDMLYVYVCVCMSGVFDSRKQRIVHFSFHFISYNRTFFASIIIALFERPFRKATQRFSFTATVTADELQ